MKFTSTLSTLLLVLPFLAQQVSATPLGFNSGVAVGQNAAPAKAVSTPAKAATSAKAAATSAKAAATSAKAAATSAKAVVTTSAKAVASSAAAAKGTAAASSVVVASSAAAAASATASAAAANSGDAQSSLTLDPKVIATGFENDGQDVPTAGQVASLTSSNNFINFCLTVPNLPITNGQQVKTGSCNPAPMGVIAAQTNMPSSKFTFPTNGATIKANTEFTISMAISHLETGFFVNANENYFAAPQFVNSAGDVQGHSHVVVELLTSLTQTTPTTPTVFAFFKGLNDKAANGILTADVTNGLPAGTYRLASINTAANHQPVLVAVAQHGSTDDQVYFTVTDDGAASSNSSFSTTSVAAVAASTTAAAAKTTTAAAVKTTTAAAAATSSVAIKGANTGKTPGVQGGFSGNSGKGNQGKGNQNQGKPPASNKGGNNAAAQPPKAPFGQNAFPPKGNNNQAKGGFFGRFKVRRNSLNRL